MQRLFTFIIEIVIMYECDYLILIRKSALLPSRWSYIFQYLCQFKKFNRHWTPAFVNTVSSTFLLRYQMYNTIFLFSFSFHNKSNEISINSFHENRYNYTNKVKLKVLVHFSAFFFFRASQGYLYFVFPSSTGGHNWS